MAEYCKKCLKSVMSLTFKEGKKYGWWCGENGLCEGCVYDYLKVKIPDGVLYTEGKCNCCDKNKILCWCGCETCLECLKRMKL